MYATTPFSLAAGRRLPRMVVVALAALIAAVVLMGPVAQQVDAAPARESITQAVAAPVAAAPAFAGVATFEMTRIDQLDSIIGAVTGACDVQVISAICGAISTGFEFATNPVGAIIDLANDAFDQVITKMMNSFVSGFATATSMANAELFAQSTGTAGMTGGAIQGSRVLDASFTKVYGRVVGVGFMLCLPMLLLAIVQALFEQKPGKLLRSLVIILPLACIGMIAAVTLVDILMKMTDGMASWIAADSQADITRFTQGLIGFGQELGVDASPGGSGQDAVGSGIMGFIMAMGALLFAMMASVFVWLAMLVRDMGVLISTLFLPLGFAMAIWPAAMKWAKRLAELVLAFIFGKILIVGVLALGASLLATPNSDYDKSAQAMAALRAPLAEYNAALAQQAGVSTTVPAQNPALNTAQPRRPDIFQIVGAAGMQDSSNGGDTSVASAQSRSLSRLLLGAMVIFLAAFSPFTVLKMIPLAEAGMAGALEGRERHMIDKSKSSANGALSKASMATGTAVNAKNLGGIPAPGSESAKSGDEKGGAGANLGGPSSSINNSAGGPMAEGDGAGGGGGASSPSSNTSTSTNNSSGAGGSTAAQPGEAGESGQAGMPGQGAQGGAGGSGGTGGAAPNATAPPRVKVDSATL